MKRPECPMGTVVWDAATNAHWMALQVFMDDEQRWYRLPMESIRVQPCVDELEDPRLCGNLFMSGEPL